MNIEFGYRNVLKHGQSEADDKLLRGPNREHPQYYGIYLGKEDKY
jgi:hypothetical protein